MRKLRKFMSVTVAATIMATSIDMGNLMTVDAAFTEKEVLSFNSEQDTAEIPSVPTAIPSVPTAILKFTVTPEIVPTQMLTAEPTVVQEATPTTVPTAAPTTTPTAAPTITPEPAVIPEIAVTSDPTATPKITAAPEPTATPEPITTPTDIPEPTAIPTKVVTAVPTEINGFVIEDGVLVKYAGTDEKIVVPSEVTSIGKKAFYNCSNVSSIELPEGVTSIGEQAFSRCTGLKSITIPEGVKKIRTSAFSGCSNLSTIEIPNSVKWMADNTFLGCSNLIIHCMRGSYAETYAQKKSISYQYIVETDFVVENGVLLKYVGTNSDVVIPEGITEISYAAFANCTDLKSIKIPEGVTTIGEYAFSGCSNLSKVELPIGVVSIKGYAFNECSSLSNIEIPKGTTSIGCNAFYSCTNLSKIEIPAGVTYIGWNAFSNCSGLTSVDLPDGITNIGYAVFENCSNLSSIKLSKGMKSIGARAFSGCSNLNSIEIPEGVTSIGEWAFRECSSLESVQLPAGVTSIGDRAFEYCSNLSNIQLPTELISIGNWAFDDCKKISNIKLPDKLTSIGAWAFCSCESIHSIEIPESVTEIGKSAFLLCGWNEGLGEERGKQEFTISCTKGSYGAAYVAKYMPYIPCNLVGNVSGETIKTISAPVTEVIQPKTIYKVYTEADLREMMNHPKDTFQLMNDIVIKNSWDSIKDFSGTLDGGGYTISNVTNTLFWSLTKESVVRDLSISGNIITNGGKTAVLFALNAAGTIENCVTKGSIRQTTGTGASMAGMVGVNNGIIRQCRNEADITQLVISDEFISVAGIAYVNYGMISNCENTGTIESGSSATGGIAGGYFISFTRRNGLIFNCINKGKIHSDYEGASVGGIAAANRALIYNCINEGIVSTDSTSQNVGGICGTMTRYAYIIKCKNSANINSGICGSARIISGGFDENDNFTVNPGNIIIADCENIVNGMQEEDKDNSKIYNLCGSADTKNGEIRLTRCKNVVNGEIREIYFGSMIGEKQGSVIAEDNGDVEALGITNGAPISINLDEKKDLGLLTEAGVSGIFIDSRFIGWMENDGIYTPEMAGKGTAYYIYTDGSVVAHPFEVKEREQSLTATPTPAVSTPDTPQVSPSQNPTDIPQVSPIQNPTDIPQVSPTENPTDIPVPTSAQKKKKVSAITAKDITKTYGSKSFNIGAKTTSDGKLTYKSADKKVVTVSDSGKVSIKGCGKTIITIKVSETSQYKSAEKKITITIKPKKQKVSSVKSTAAKTITVKWNKDTKATGYIFQYSTDKNFKKNVKTVTISKNKTTSKKISKLKSGKKYYVRICSYKKVSGEKIQGSYSAVKSVKVQ